MQTEQKIWSNWILRQQNYLTYPTFTEYFVITKICRSSCGGPLFVGPLFGRTCWTCLNPPLVIGLGPSHIVLDGDPATPTERGTAVPSLFGPCLLWRNGRPSQQLLSSCWSSNTTLAGRVRAVQTACSTGSLYQCGTSLRRAFTEQRHRDDNTAIECGGDDRGGCLSRAHTPRLMWSVI